MSLIEGFGDEVSFFFILATIVVVAFMILAWKSTEVRDQSIAAATNTSHIAFTVTQVVLQSRNGQQQTGPATAATVTPSYVESPTHEEEPLPPMNPDVILSHQANGTGWQTPQEQAEAATSETAASNEDEKEMKAVLELMDDDTTAQQGYTDAECTLRRRNPAAEASSSEARPIETISIRLKYMDDTQRTVDSPPSTSIGNFKRFLMLTI